MTPRNIRIVDPAALERNMAALRSAVPRSAEIMAVVKADGYGHGAETAARAALKGGAGMLAVATVEEGVRLREAGLDAPILVLGALSAEDAREGAENHLIQTVCSPEMVRILQAACEGLPEPAEVHLKVDSGMGRIGVRTAAERDRTLAAVEECGRVRLTGAFTHFSDADAGAEGEAYSQAQFERFRELTDGLGVRRHCANSAASLRHPEWALDMVREGISLYGYPPFTHSQSSDGRGVRVFYKQSDD